MSVRRQKGNRVKGKATRWAAIAAMTWVAAVAAADGPAPLAPGDGRICFYRETWHALSVQPEVTIDGQVVGKALPNEWFCVDRKPGTYEVSTVSEPDRKFSVTLGSGQTRYASLEFTVTWFLVAHINPELVDNATGEKGSAGLRYHSN
jgi:hypothetical protein